MTEHANRPYEGGVCAIYFQALLKEEESPCSDCAITELYLDNVSLDAGHVIIHYLVTGIYQCLKPEKEAHEKMTAAELTTALQVYVATDILSVPELREMARAEIVSLGNQLLLPALIKVMEDAALSFDAHPGIATYLQYRILSFSQDEHPFMADNILRGMGAPDSLSKALLRSIALSKASVWHQLEDPTYQLTVGDCTALVLRPAEKAMKRSEEQALSKASKAQADCEAEEAWKLEKKKVKKGKLGRKNQERLDTLLLNQEERAQEEDEEKQIATSRMAELEKPFTQKLVDTQKKYFSSNGDEANGLEWNQGPTWSDGLEAEACEPYGEAEDETDSFWGSISTLGSSLDSDLKF
ncbi:hypothetical protein IL306_005460 [Fusarium sp. DS 682]|nr:hypothetical protein IL306_005460 [Fusarium sp. DS 682]